MDEKDNSLEEQKQMNEVLQKEIDWLKLSMDIDKHSHAGTYNALLQNIASMLILFLGILASVNLLITHYLISWDVFHFILVNFCLILIFIMVIKGHEIKEKNKIGGIGNIEKEFKIKKFMVMNRYKGMGVDIEGIQKEFGMWSNVF